MHTRVRWKTRSTHKCSTSLKSRRRRLSRRRLAYTTPFAWGNILWKTLFRIVVGTELCTDFRTLNLQSKPWPTESSHRRTCTWTPAVSNSRKSNSHASSETPKTVVVDASLLGRSSSRWTFVEHLCADALVGISARPVSLGLLPGSRRCVGGETIFFLVVHSLGCAAEEEESSCFPSQHSSFLQVW